MNLRRDLIWVFALLLIGQGVCAEPVASRPRIGLVLSGGGARGAAHVGVLRVLEQARIPIDVIVGTSMGAIVGGAYASGARVDDMEAALATLNTTTLFTDEPPRGELTMRRKDDERQPLFGPQFGVSADGLSLPRGAVSGIALEAVLRRLVRAERPQDFDLLPIPFRAVATDIESGRMQVFDHGDLATAMRASMSVPGLVAPMEHAGHLYVDGGLTRNLPIDVARAMGADVIIAVNVGSPLLRREQIGSLLGVSAQMIAILTEQNVQQSLSELTESDVLIVPALGDFSAADFDHMPQTVTLGEAGARERQAQFQALGLAPEAYAQWQLARQVAPVATVLPIARILVEGAVATNPDVIRAMLQTQVGALPDRAVLDADMRRLYGIGDFDHVAYRVEEFDGEGVLTLSVREKGGGPRYVRFGLGLQSDMRGEAFFDLYARYRSTWLNTLGGEARVDARLGRENRLVGEFYQPVDTDQRFFVAPRFEVMRRPLDIYLEDVRIARFDEIARLVGLDVGADFGRRLEWRTGLVAGTRHFDLAIGPAELAQAGGRVRFGASRTQVRYDSLDALDFPREGWAWSTDLLASRRALGSDDNYTRWSGQTMGAQSWRSHTVQWGLEAGGRVGDDLIPLQDQFRLGGPFRLSGYRPGQFVGQEMQLARVVYTDRVMEQQLLRGAFVGLSLEAGHVGQSVLESMPARWRWSVSGFVAVDSPIGPLYLGAGLAPGGQRTAYVFLGRP